MGLWGVAMGEFDDLRKAMDPDGSLGRTINKHFETFNDIPAWCHVTCHCCPVQAEGTMKDGRLWYFRARSGEWRIDIGDAPGEDPIGNTKHEGEDIDDGWMPGPEMLRLIEEHIGSEVSRG